MPSHSKNILIVGGGITGLTSAYYLHQSIKRQGLPYNVTLVEKADRLGGKIHTEEAAGLVIERGPDSFLARKTAILELTRELGLENELVGTNPAARKNYILHRNKLHLMPPGLILGIPTQWTPFVKTGLISPFGKCRAALDLVMPAATASQDESLGHFLTRRLGKEVAENIAEPLLSGIYAGDTQVLSLNSTFPQFKQLEEKYGSLIKGMMKTRDSRNANTADYSPMLPPDAKSSIFLTFKKGLQTLVNGLTTQMEGVHLKPSVEVKKLTRESDSYAIQLSNGEHINAHAIILAIPAYAARPMLTDVEASVLLEKIPYVSVANVVFAYNKMDLDYSFDASGFVIPRSEGRNITACTWTSSKWPQTTPDDKILLRCYVGHSKDETLVHESDDVLIERVQADLKDILGITAAPILTRITRWEKSMPQYLVGHLDRLEELRSQLRTAMPGVILSGAGYNGVGLPDCILQAKQASLEVVSLLAE